MKKKFLAVMLMLVMITALCACGSSSGTSDQAGTEPIKVGFVHIGDENDLGYTYNHNQATLAMVEALGGESAVQTITKWNVPEGAECADALRELAEEGCSIIFATSFGFEDYVMQVAPDYPDIEFCHATGYQCSASDLPNVHNYFAKIFEGRYLAGIVAGMKANEIDNNKIGYVGAFPYAEVISGYTSFYEGVKSVCPDATMEVIYVNSWYDQEQEYQAAKTLIDDGCGIISQHSDSTGPATACAEAENVFHIGYNNSMIEAAPEASIISSKVDWSAYVIYAVQCVMNGETIDKDWCGDFAGGAVKLTELNEAIAPEGAAEALEAAEAGLADGSINVFAGPMKGVNGEGETIDLAEGEFYPENEKSSCPSFDYVIDGITIK